LKEAGFTTLKKFENKKIFSRASRLRGENVLRLGWGEDFLEILKNSELYNSGGFFLGLSLVFLKGGKGWGLNAFHRGKVNFFPRRGRKLRKFVGDGFFGIGECVHGGILTAPQSIGNL
jgi:hypothetical protein